MADDNADVKDNALTPRERMRRLLWAHYEKYPMDPACAAHLEHWFSLGEPPMPPARTGRPS